MSAILDAALSAHRVGLCVYPPAEDGTKRPMGEWKAYQKKRPGEADVRSWYGSRTGLGLVCGAVSGNLECLEFEGRAMRAGLGDEFTDRGNDVGLGELLERISTGYLEETPSGGLHALYRVDGKIGGNTALARRPATRAELSADPNAKIKPLIETRAEGGYIVTAPSNGRVHPTGGAYELLTGGFDSIATITAEEREALFELARSFDQVPVQEWTPRGGAATAGGRPGDDFNERGEWAADVLDPADWTYVRDDGDGWALWRRPGKAHGVSGAVTPDGGLFVAYSTSTPFEIGRGYSKFRAYAILRHDGNFTAAARTLRADGYGDDDPDGWVDTTELSNARRLVGQYGDIIRYCKAWGQWIIWDGCRWKPDSIGRIDQLAKETVRGIFEEAAKANDENGRTRLSKWAVSSQKRATLTNMVKLAETEPGVPVEPYQLDADPWLLNVLNGTIDLKTGLLRPHNPDQLMTKLAPVEYSRSAKCPRWDRFMLEVMNGDADKVAYLQRAAGLSLVGELIEHVLFLLYGTGRNGKDTFLETLSDALGDYAYSAEPELLLIKKQESHPENIASLQGKRFVHTSEPNRALQMAEATVKWLTGKKTLNARQMYSKRFNFESSHTLFLAANHRPIITGQDTGIWSRVKEIPFTVSFHGREDKHLYEKLAAELPGVLAWAVRGCLDWQQRGKLDEPASITDATKGYREDMDVIGDFLDDVCEVREKLMDGSEAWTERTGLYHVYAQWCSMDGMDPLSARMFYRALRERGFEVDYRPTENGAQRPRSVKGLRIKR